MEFEESEVVITNVVDHLPAAGSRSIMKLPPGRRVRVRVRVRVSYSSEVVGCGGGGAAPSPVKNIFLNYYTHRQRPGSR